MNIGQRIKEARKALKLSQTEFGEHVNLTQNYISLLETGDRMLADRTLKDICRYYGISEPWLRDGIGSMFNDDKEYDEIKTFLHKIISDDDSSFKKRFISVCAKMTETEWDIIERRIKEITAEDKRKEQSGDSADPVPLEPLQS